MATCNVYKNGLLLGAGTLANDATTLASWVPVAAAALTPNGASFVGRNVQVMITSSTDVGKVWPCRITADDGGGNLTVTGRNCSGGTFTNPYAT